MQGADWNIGLGKSQEIHSTVTHHQAASNIQKLDVLTETKSMNMTTASLKKVSFRNAKKLGVVRSAVCFGW